MATLLRIGLASTAFFGVVGVSMAVLSVVMTRQPETAGGRSNEIAVAVVAVVAITSAMLCAAAIVFCILYFAATHYPPVTAGGD